MNPSQNPDIEQLVREAIRTNRNILAIPLNTRNRHWDMLITNFFRINYFHYDSMQAMASVDGAGRKTDQIKRIINELSGDHVLTELKFTRQSIKETDTSEVLEILKNLMQSFFKHKRCVIIPNLFFLFEINFFVISITLSSLINAGYATPLFSLQGRSQPYFLGFLDARKNMIIYSFLVHQPKKIKHFYMLMYVC